MRTEAERVQLTVSCHDADDIPKVADAGSIVNTVDGTAQVMHNGVLVVEGCYYGDWMTEIIRTLRGHHEPQEERVFHEIVERVAGDTAAPTMVELGAFWAYYSLWMLQRVPQTRAILVEPDPNNLEVARANLALNGRQAELVQAAVGAAAGPPQPFCCESDGLTRPVATASIRSLLERFDIDRIDVLLADVQGAEVELLGGAADLLADRVRFLVVSTHHHLISGDPLTHERCLAALHAAGAHIIAEHTVAESFSGDGLIAVSFDDRDRDIVVALSAARARESLFGDPLSDLAAEQEARRESDARAQSWATEVAEVREASATAAAAAQGSVAAAEAEVAAMSATATWRLHRRLHASRGGRAVLRTGSRMARILRAPRGTAARTS
jgi:FkbM family methyltransferase